MQPTLPYEEMTAPRPVCDNLADGWKVARLGDLIEIKHGFAFAGQHFTEAPSSLPVVVTIGNYRYEGGFRFETTPIKRYRAEYPKEYELATGDIVLAMTCQTMDGEILGLPAKIPEDDNIYLHNQRLGKVIIKQPGKVVAEFLYWVFLSQDFNKYLVQTASGTKVRHTAPGRIEAYVFRLPPIHIQRTVAEVLDAAETAALMTERLIEAKTRYKRALAEQLLMGRRRFPEFTEQPWRRAPLGAFFSERAAQAPEGETPIVLSCSKLYGVLPQSERFSKPMASRDLRRYKYAEPGDLVFDPMLLWDASIGFSDLRGVVSPAYCTFRFVAEEADWRYFRHLFTTHALRHVYKTISQGTNARRKKVLPSDFLRVAVDVPDLPEQRRIADVLGLVDEEIVLLRRQLDALKRQKQGLMHRLLSGEVRVKEYSP